MTPAELRDWSAGILVLSACMLGVYLLALFGYEVTKRYVTPPDEPKPADVPIPPGHVTPPTGVSQVVYPTRPPAMWPPQR